MENPKINQIIQEIEALRQQLFVKLATIDEAQLNRQPSPGKWSVLQIVHHLVISETGTVGYIRKKTQKPEAIPAVGLSASLKMKLLLFVFSINIKFKAPPILANPPQVLSRDTTFADWEKTRLSLSQLVKEIPEEVAKKGLFKHPLVGRINLLDTLIFTKYHFKHHLKQISAII